MNRPAIPEDIKRAVRQHCGFGCVFCGSPVYDYDHIVEYSVVEEHTEANLVLLCPTCHRKKGKGLISQEAIVQARSLATARAATEADNFESRPYQMDIGGNIVQAFPGGLGFRIDGFGHFGFELDRVPKINAEILKLDGFPAITIVDGKYTLYSDTWDIEYVGNTLTFRNAPRDVFASIAIDATSLKVVIRGTVEISEGVKLRITDNGIFANDTLVAMGNDVQATSCALLITSDPPKVGVMWQNAYTTANIIQGIDGVSCFNCIAQNNFMHSCRYAFVWTPNYLAAQARRNS